MEATLESTAKVASRIRNAEHSLREEPQKMQKKDVQIKTLEANLLDRQLTIEQKNTQIQQEIGRLKQQMKQEARHYAKRIRQLEREIEHQQQTHQSQQKDVPDA